MPSTASPGPRVLVIGAGIGGLTTALCLERIGIAATICESVTAIRPLGVGINLLPHSVRVLTDLGLADHLDGIGVRTAELCYYNKLGQRIWSEPRGLAAGYKWPQFSVHRGQLQALLYNTVIERLGASSIRAAHSLERIDVDGDCDGDGDGDGGPATATLRNRHDDTQVTIDADVIIAADGINSAARRQRYPDEGPPKFAGQLLWRATTIASPFLTGRSMIMAGHQRQKFVCYPIATLADGRSVINWIAERRIAEPGSGAQPPRPSDWNREIDRETFAPLFASWKFDWLDIPALIAGAERVYEFPMVDRDPLPRWTFGRATLLGDAAHPMYPIGSNGASQAILDAEAIALALRDEGCVGSVGGVGGVGGVGDLRDASSVRAALARYEDARRPATASIVASNRGMGPERVMQIVEERAPNGFDRLAEVISDVELNDIASQYKQIAGFDPATLNRIPAGRVSASLAAATATTTTHDRRTA